MSTSLRQTDRKRAAILNAAICEFRQLGYDATSMDKIAATAQVSKRTVYNHFPCKEDLFTAILMLLWQRAATQDDLVYRSDCSLEQQLSTYLQHKLSLFSDPDFLDLVRVAIAATIHTPDRAREVVDKFRQNEPAIVNWMRAAQADGRLAGTDPHWMSEMLIAQIKGLAFWPQVTMGQPVLNPEQRDNLLKQAVWLFLRGYAQGGA
ncbi:TetR/AcrR family transcriptional regulator [Undibacterium rugosum]|uniref:TetR/AcrR family transcriptional regulator n=1 Tax=Undibacterium rugosum TaxID=2762291 RepID=A0A923I847_9BURK|nr:TetR/AcrR family transcriptional regulator [Undibacterium rugosum]MBC3934395.1 TetR/AcrR family transcriptional regulator [Undibacterium rugosum]MBR7777010.1 TetR/AcrR family transcriptional regulator [Undibacterium rugosum]